MNRKTYQPEDIKNLLTAAAETDPLAAQILRNQNRKSLMSCINEEKSGKKSLTADDIYTTILEGMRSYLNGHTAPPSYRQKLWECCKNWAYRIAEEMDYNPDNHFEADITKPIEEDTGIRLIKELHEENGLTKETLSKILGVDERTIRNNLNSLSQEISQANNPHKPHKPYRIAGQEVRVQIRAETDQDGRKIYSTPERLHPLILQLNTFQVCTLLRALQCLNETGNHDACLGIATDIWCQLSESGKSRIKEKNYELYPDFSEFAEDLDSLCDGEIHPVFRTESEMDDISKEESLILALKSELPHILTLHRNGRLTKYENYIIRVSEQGVGNWIAIPAEEFPNLENALYFNTDEVYGYAEKVPE